MASFTPRLTKPEKGNKYYITKAKGGYSDAIKGKPTDPDCDVLANCVGYAYGRFNEIGNWGSCKYLYPTNAENFIQYAKGLEVGQTPKVGACMVWRKGATLSGSDGAGHVAIVEKVISDTEVVTSESGWNSSKPFWTQTRKKGSDNRWGSGSAYTFLGFIYNPAECCQNSEPPKKEETPVKTPTQSQIKVDYAQRYDKNKGGKYKVKANGGLHLRTGASTSKTSLEIMPNGSTVTCYGYYTGSWLLVVSASGKTGFCHSNYLVKC